MCTLATCKPQIRETAEVGDLIFGCGSKAIGLEERVICALRITGKSDFQDYWDNPRFLKKRPYVAGNQRRAYGDNIYHKDFAGNWIQEWSHHSLPDGSVNLSNLERDTGADCVLWSDDFVYWGRDAPLIPPNLRDCDGDDLYPSGRSYRSRFSTAFIDEARVWFDGINLRGCRGRPASWE